MYKQEDKVTERTVPRTDFFPPLMLVAFVYSYIFSLAMHRLNLLIDF